MNTLKATDALLPGELPQMPVVVGDNVGHYFAQYPEPVDVGDVVSVLLPPFRQMFVDIQGAPNRLGLKAWGVRFDATRITEPQDRHEAADAWEVEAVVFGEWRTGDAVGPIARYFIPLDAQGHARPSDREGYGSLFGGVVALPGMPDDAREDANQHLLRPLAGALLTISFMHCKNVDVIDIEPPPQLSKKHLRKHGVPLTRYRVLDIDPMRRVLAREGTADALGLRQALHICRGHFKTFTEASPLFGKYTGTYWWAEQLRGDAGSGVVLKDYRVRVDQGGLGREYEAAEEHTELASVAENKGRDPDLGGRGLHAHNVTQNLLADAVTRAGFLPRRPKPEEPQYDLAWQAGDSIWVAEVKSLTPTNEERQLRLALGQVLRYQQLIDGGGRRVRAMIAVERQPIDDRWLDLCGNQGVVLVWAASFDQAVAR
jgi:hypothetical protein